MTFFCWSWHRSVVRLHAVHQEAAGPGEARDHLGEVGGAPCGQRFERRHLGAEGRPAAAAVAVVDKFIDDAAPVGKLGKSRDPRRIRAWARAA